MPTASIPRLPPSTSAPDWWRRPGLDTVAGRLTVAGHDAEAMAREHGTPVFAYDIERVRENVRAFHAAARGAGLEHRLRFALKANREPEVLAALRELGSAGERDAVGIDACSPGEIEHALTHGWTAAEISYTGTNVSERDLDVILGAGVHLNLDATSQVERVGRRAPGTTIGLRVNPMAGAGYNETLTYSGDRPTKLGITTDRLDDALAAARRHDLTVDTLHFHAGSGWLADGLGGFEAALVEAVGLARRLLAAGCPLAEVNVGGGIGRIACQSEQPVDLDAYMAVVARHLRPLGVAVGFEPGDLIVKDAAVLLAEVVTIEDRAGVRFVGLDAGWNVFCSWFIYRFAQELVLCRAADAQRTELVTVVGHINEAGDVFVDDYPMPPLREGDIVALLNAGGYEQAMSMTHCLRPLAAAAYLERR
ncbi:MAG: diaminopimelate decarboxylase family protein [Candidatus Limnocylindrales bacterium]